MNASSYFRQLALAALLYSSFTLALQFKYTGSAEVNNCSLGEDASSEIALLARSDKGSGTGCMGFPLANLLSSSSSSSIRDLPALGGSGVDYMTMVRRYGADAHQRRKDGQLAVWVSGYPRSGSSTVLSMISATVDDNRAAGQTFSLFEPCHGGDVLEKWKEHMGCQSLLYGLTRCNFTGVKKLWGWADPHSTNNFSAFSAEAAHDVCEEADIVAFKTVDYGHELSSWTWLLDSHPNMRVVDVVRDPRGIYASWKTLEPFASLVKSGTFYTLTEICDHFDMNIAFKDPRVHRVVFEDLMKFPSWVTQDVYKFLGEPFGEEQQTWVNVAFNNKDCPPPKPGMNGFTDCHTDSDSVVEKWRSVLSQHELDAFANSASCQRIAEYYGYPQ